MSSIVSIKDLSKTYNSGFEALKNINLDIKKGEILALLGPNGAGKTTLISTICGIVSPTSGTVTVDGNDIITDFRKTRAMIGLVPQELTLGLLILCGVRSDLVGAYLALREMMLILSNF